MSRTLEDFVSAASELLGKVEEETISMRVHQMIDRMNVHKDDVASVRDDVLIELGLLTSSKRKTNRYFPTPKTFANDREEYVYGLAKRFVRSDGRSQSRIEKVSRGWAFQEARAGAFLETHERHGSLKYPITLDELLGAIRSLNARKGAQTRMVRTRSKKKKKTPLEQPRLI